MRHIPDEWLEVALRPLRLWRSSEAVEFTTLEWVDWFNNRRLPDPIEDIPPAEAESRYHEHGEILSLAA